VVIRWYAGGNRRGGILSVCRHEELDIRARAMNALLS